MVYHNGSRGSLGDGPEHLLEDGEARVNIPEVSEEHVGTALSGQRADQVLAELSDADLRRRNGH